MKASYYDNTTPHITTRSYQSDDDFALVRNLLIETYLITPLDFNWNVRRWEGQRYYNPDPALDPAWAAKICLRETEEGQVIGAVLPEGNGHPHLQLHPDYRYIEEDMIAWAEENHAAKTEDGKRWLEFFVYEYDSRRCRLLAQRGYEKQPEFGVIRRLRFGLNPIPEPVLAEGYSLRSVRPDDMADCQQIAGLLNAAFNRDFHNPAEFHTFTKMAPSYHSDLDLVALGPNGSFAAYVGMPYEEVNKTGIFEPVCTHPDHRKKGLAKTLMLEALHRVRALGAVDAHIGTGDMEAANRLYDSIGFTEKYVGYYWKKEL